MKIRTSMRWLILLGISIACVVHATTPASTLYLVSKMALIQAEIDEINLKIFGS